MVEVFRDISCHGFLSELYVNFELCPGRGLSLSSPSTATFSGKGLALARDGL